MRDSAKVYNKFFLALYDLYVIHFSARFVWKIPPAKLLKFFNDHISANHLDVGVGTGYFLDKATFPDNAQIGLIDINPATLEVAGNRIKRYHPKAYKADILYPLPAAIPKADSISLNFLLHCLPGNFYEKEVVFKHLMSHLNPNGIIFGSTILGKVNRANWLGKRLLSAYNSAGVFGNLGDKIEDLKAVLARNFKTYSVEEVGLVVMFSAKDPL